MTTWGDYPLMWSFGIYAWIVVLARLAPGQTQELPEGELSTEKLGGYRRKDS